MKVMLRAPPWLQSVRAMLLRGVCALAGHRPVALESERHDLNETPRWRFRCGDCGRRYWWP